MIIKSVESINQCKSMILTSYDIVIAHGGEVSNDSIQCVETEISVTETTR